MITMDLDRRVLGALRFVSSVNRLPIAHPLKLRPAPAAGQPSTPPVKILRNRRGLFVVHSAPGFATYIESFDSVPIVPNRSLLLQVSDPSGSYFPATVSIALPRPLNAVRVNGELAGDSVFRPVDVELLPAPAASLSSGWAVVRASLSHQTEEPPASGNFVIRPVRGALVRVITDVPNPQVPQLLGQSLTEWRGIPNLPPPADAEAMVPIPGIPLTTWSNQPNGSVLTQNQSVRVQVRVDAQFNPDIANAIPSLDRLAPAGNLPVGVSSFELANPIVLRTGARTNLNLRINPDNSLSSV